MQDLTYKADKKMGWWTIIFYVALAVLASYTFVNVDKYFHTKFQEEPLNIDKVSDSYFSNKYIFSFIAFLLYFTVLLWIPTWFYAPVMAILLQYKYLNAGYSPLFHIIFIPLHTLIIFVIIFTRKLFMMDMKGKNRIQKHHTEHFH